MHAYAQSRTFAGPRALAGLAAASFLAAASPAAADGGGAQEEYRIIETSTSFVLNDLVRTESTVQVGDDPVNRFTMVRVVKNVPTHALRGSIVLQPPLANGFVAYEETANGRYADSLVASFARRGYDVWGLSKRSDELALGDCESGVVDCRAMKDWGLSSMMEDAEFVREQIMAVHPGQLPIVGGLSLGSMLATALINAHPNDYAGALLIEGALYDANPANRATAQVFCDQFKSLLDLGVYYDAQSLPGFKLIAALATTDPDDLSPLPGFPAGFTNHQVFVSLMSAPGVTPITPREGYFFLAGDPEADQFFFADDASVRANIATFGDYAPTRIISDVNCALAGETSFTDDLASFHGPVLMFAAGHGFGPGMLDTAQFLSNAELTIHFDEDFGHVDHFFAMSNLSMAQPIKAWIESSF